MSAATCVRCQSALGPEDTHGLCGACLADGLALALDPGSAGPEQAGGLGAYELLEEIARGGMGIVYRARHRGLNRMVALKIVHATAGQAGAGIERLRTEAELAATLEHPNIVPVYDVGTGDGRPWFTMKLAEGGSLADRMETYRLPDRAGAGTARGALGGLARLFAAIARGVHHAHQHGVLHRDLKPSNILLDRGGEPMVADFGIAVRSDVDATITQTGAALGTPAYLAPEVARGGPRDASVAADIYGLGAILFHLLTGRPPYVGASAFEVLSRIGTEEIPSPRTLNPAVPPDWETLCRKCLERTPERRYASALEVAEECDRLQRGEPVLARPVGSSERLWLWTRRRPLVAALAMAAMAAVGLGLAGVFWQWRQAEDARHLAESRALEAGRAEERARDAGYFATLAQVLALRQQGDLGNARRLLEGLEAGRRGFEWRLLHWLSRGDDDRRWSIPDGDPRCMIWEPNRGRLAVLGEDRVLHWVDPSNGHRETGPTVPIAPATEGVEVLDRGFHELAFAPDGRHFSCSDGDMLLVVETDTGRLVFSAVRRRISALWLDSRRLLYCGNTVWMAANTGPGGILDLVTGREEPLPRAVYAPLALSADRRTVAWTRDREDGLKVEVFPASTLTGVAAGLAKPADVVDCGDRSPGVLALAPDVRHLAMVMATEIGSPRMIRVAELPGGRTVFEHDAQAFVHGIVFSADGTVLSAGTADTALRQFRYLQAVPMTSTYDDDALPGLAQTVPEAGPRFPPNNLLSRTALEGRVQFRLGHGERIRALLELPGPGPLVSLSDDRTLRFWAPLEERSLHRVGGLSTGNRWEHPAISADGRYALYRAGTDQTWLWDRTRLRRVPIAEGHYPLAVLRDGSAVTRNGQTGEIVVWMPPGDGGEGPGERWKVAGIRSHPGFPFVVRGVLSQDERVLAGLIPGKLLTLDLAARTTVGTRDQRMLYGASAVNCLDLSPDGRLIAVTGFIGRRVRLYRADDLKAAFVPLGDAPDYDTAVAFHPDGRRLFVGNEDGWVRVFDVVTREERVGERWRAQAGPVTALTVSGDGQQVVTSGDRTMVFWDAGSMPLGPRRERLRIGVAAPRNWMRFAADGTVFFHSAPGHALEAWDAPRN